MGTVINGEINREAIRDELIEELRKIGNERMRKYFMSKGARDPVFGSSTGAMKPLAKPYRNDQALAELLYDSGVYDAMYLAGMIANPKTMTEADFERWMDGAYCEMIGDHIVSVTLAESPLAQIIADRWIAHEDDLHRSSGWHTYEWLLGYLPDARFDAEKICGMLHAVQEGIHSAPEHTKDAMNGFLMAVGVSYAPLHAEALSVAQAVGPIYPLDKKGACEAPIASQEIEKAMAKGRIGFKRKGVRC